MGLFDWLGPIPGRRKDAQVPEQKASWTIDDPRALLTVRTLVHGPGATELLEGTRGLAGNSAVAACLNAITTAYPEAPLKVWRIEPGGREALFDHPLQRFLDNVNPFLPLDVILSYVQWCKRVDGNAYVRKIRSGNPLTGNVVELWPLCPSRVELKVNDGSGDFISFYRYHFGAGKYEDIEPENVVHFRMGLDDKDHRLGLGPLKALAREVSTDERATAFSDALLANFAVPGLSVTYPPSGEGVPPLTQAQADETKARIKAAFGSGNAGDVAVLVGGMKLEQHGWSPEQLNLRDLHRLPEERISAVLQVPAIVAGLGAGLDRSTFSNVREAREMFTETNLVPSWRADATTLNHQLTPDFVSDKNIRLEFDLDEVRALQDDQNAKAIRIDTLVRGGTLMIDEGRAEMGYDALPDGAGQVLMLPGAWAPTPLSHLAALAKAPAPEPATSPDSAGGVPPDQQQGPRALPQAASRGPLEFTTNTPTMRTIVWDGDLETKALSDSEILDRYAEALDPIKHALSGDLFDAFEAIAESAAARLPNARTNGKANGYATTAALALEIKQEAIAGLVTEADHAEIRSLLRSYVLKSMRSAADSLAPLTGDKPVRITRANPEVKAAIADMEKRLPGIVETTGEDFGRLVRRLERRPGSVPIEDVRQALLDYVAETYPGRAAAIARTELGYAHARGVALVMAKSGIGTRVHVHDGDGDPACRARNGETLPADEGATLGLLHPNCALRLIPIVESGNG